MAEPPNLAPAVANEHEKRLGPTRAQLKVAAGTFDLLSVPIRLHLVWLAAQGEHDVGSLDTAAPALMVRRQVVMTVLYEQILIALRRLAQEDASGRRFSSHQSAK